jgi:hypothetical protein
MPKWSALSFYFFSRAFEGEGKKLPSGAMLDTLTSKKLFLDKALFWNVKYPCSSF